MTIEQMKKRKKELGYSNNKLSEISGVPVGTIQKIFSGETTSPRFDTIIALTDALEEKVWSVQEPEAAYDTGRRYYRTGIDHEGIKTIDDYLALPEGTRIELIDGKFYDMASPTTIHQSIGLEISFLLKSYIKENKGKCVPFIAPTDVQLDGDDKTMLQPDVLVVCDRNKITKNRIIGAPDFIIEIVSPSNAITDVLVKLIKYKNAGVKEYWIVFPDEKRIQVHDFTKDKAPKDYTFDDSIPVGIWGGKCKIDFSYIYSQIEFMYR